MPQIEQNFLLLISLVYSFLLMNHLTEQTATIEAVQPNSLSIILQELCSSGMQRTIVRWGFSSFLTVADLPILPSLPSQMFIFKLSYFHINFSCPYQTIYKHTHAYLYTFSLTSHFCLQFCLIYTVLPTKNC